MKTAQLVKTIKKLDPDGRGIARVKDAAHKTLEAIANGTYTRVTSYHITDDNKFVDTMIKGDACNCVLAHAWRNGHYTSVGIGEVEFYAKHLEEREVDQYDYHTHKYKKVKNKFRPVLKTVGRHGGSKIIRWFDAEKRDIKATCNEIIQLLDGVTDTNWALHLEDA